MSAEPSSPKTLSRKAQEVIESISRDRERLLGAVAGLGPAQLEFQPSAGAWSIGEVLHHLALADDGTSRLFARFLERAQEAKLPPDPSPERSVLGTIETVVAGADEQKAVAPDRVTPRSHLDAEECLARLSASRTKLIGTLGRLSAFDVSTLTFPHPFFGELDPYQWLLITGWHERRHTAQIERNQSNGTFPRTPRP